MSFDGIFDRSSDSLQQEDLGSSAGEHSGGRLAQVRQDHPSSPILLVLKYGDVTRPRVKSLCPPANARHPRGHSFRQRISPGHNASSPTTVNRPRRSRDACSSAIIGSDPRGDRRVLFDAPWNERRRAIGVAHRLDPLLASRVENHA